MTSRSLQPNPPNSAGINQRKTPYSPQSRSCSAGQASVLSTSVARWANWSQSSASFCQIVIIRSFPACRRDDFMSQIEAAPPETVSKPILSELSPHTISDKCNALARNLWWTWHPEVINLFRDLDPIRWRQLDHNPVALLREFTAERLAQRAAEMVLYSRINYAHRRLKEYMANRQTWAAWNAGVLGSKPVAYFSAEFGLHESIPIYSGGLGVLSGDHIKSASGLGVNLVAIGLF